MKNPKTRIPKTLKIPKIGPELADMAELDVEALKRLAHIEASEFNPLARRQLIEAMPTIIVALEDRDRLGAEIRELRGLGWEHLKRDRFPLIRAILEGRDG